MKACLPLCLILFLSLCSCAGGWTEDDKKQFRASCVEQVGNQISETQRSKYCDCFMEQMVRAFPVFNDVTEHHQSDTVERLKAHCRQQIGMP